MNKRMVVLAGLALSAGLVVSVFARYGHAQGGGQAPFPNYPFSPPPSKPANPFLPGSSAAPGTPSGVQPASTPVPNGPSPNADIAVKPEVGDWVVCLTVYKGGVRT